MAQQLTAKQLKFCDEYLVDRNATQAAIRAGYRPNAAYAMGHENLRKPQIKAFLDTLVNQQAERTKVTADRVVEELAAIALFQMTDVIELNNGKLSIKNTTEWSDAAKRAVESLKIDRDGNVHIKAHSKVPALKMLGDHLGTFNDFNAALATIMRYGTVITKDDDPKTVNQAFEFQACIPEDWNHGDEND